jgi:hypothetical protein
LSRVNIETLLFCLAWAGLAVVAVSYGGWTVGLALAIGLFLAISASTGAILSRSGDLGFERKMRWGILIAGWIALIFYLAR